MSESAQFQHCKGMIDRVLDQCALFLLHSAETRSTGLPMHTSRDHILRESRSLQRELLSLSRSLRSRCLNVSERIKTTLQSATNAHAMLETILSEKQMNAKERIEVSSSIRQSISSMEQERLYVLNSCDLSQKSRFHMHCLLYSREKVNPESLKCAIHIPDSLRIASYSIAKAKWVDKKVKKLIKSDEVSRGIFQLEAASQELGRVLETFDDISMEGVSRLPQSKGEKDWPLIAGSFVEELTTLRNKQLEFQEHLRAVNSFHGLIEEEVELVNNLIGEDSVACLTRNFVDMNLITSLDPPGMDGGPP